MPRLLIALVLLLPLSCSDQDPPVSQSAFDEEAGPWQTASVNGELYRRVAAKANATAQSSDLRISIPINDQSNLPDTIVIAGRIYTANCLPDTVDSLSIEIPPLVAVDSSSVEIPPLVPVDSSSVETPPVAVDSSSVETSPVAVDSLSVETPPVAVDSSSVETPDPPGLSDRDILMIFYRATGGGTDWTGDNWGSDEPIGTWQGVTTNADGRVTHLSLYAMELNGSIPAELGQLTNLQQLFLFRNGNGLSGSIPAELGQLTNLKDLRLAENGLSGSIPAELGTLTNLENLRLSGNELSGSIPAEQGNRIINGHATKV